MTILAAETTTPGRRAQVGLVAFTLAGGMAIFVGGTPYFQLTAANDNPLYNGALVGAFGLLGWWLRGRPSLASYEACSQALFVAAAAMFVLVVGPFNWLVTSHDEVVQAFQDKLAQFLAVVPVILILTWAMRRPWGSVYLQNGLPKRWLVFGLSSFGISSIAIAGLALLSGISSTALLSAAPWIVVFAMLNSSMEEVWFRGIFLRPYSAAMGGAAAIAVTAFVFAEAHVGATYVSSVLEHLLLVALAVAIGFVAARVISWADSLWGAVLFHMGLDLHVDFGLVQAV